MDASREMDFAARLITKTARRMIGKTALIDADRLDLQQDLWLELLRRLPGYQPERGGSRAFITLVVRNAAASILTARSAAKRGAGRPLLSLDKEINDEDGDPIDYHESISVDDYLRRTRGAVRTEEERRDLAIDVRHFVSALPAGERMVCLLLVEMDVTDIAGIVGIPRSTLRDLIDRMRGARNSRGLEEYRQCSRRLQPSSGK